MQQIKPYPFGSSFGPPTTSQQASPPPRTSTATAPTHRVAVVKIIDWAAVAWAMFDYAVCTLAGLAELGSKTGLSALLLPGAVLALVVLVQKLAGVVFDPTLGTVRFYSFFLPRVLHLAEIRDANCEFVVSLSPSHLALAICGGGSGGPRGRGSSGQRTYMVNMSGSFGSRQVRFYSKRWRDQFLGVWSRGVVTLS